MAGDPIELLSVKDIFSGQFAANVDDPPHCGLGDPEITAELALRTRLAAASAKCLEGGK